MKFVRQNSEKMEIKTEEDHPPPNTHKTNNTSLRTSPILRLDSLSLQPEHMISSSHTWLAVPYGPKKTGKISIEYYIWYLFFNYFFEL